MLDRLDWETYWRWELFRRACDPLDFRRWKRDSSRELRALFPASDPPPLLLDSTCGLGDHTVNLAEEGFRVEACDRSPAAREATTRALADAGLAARVPVFDAEWHDLARTHAGRYDLIFNDALHWTYDPTELDAALRGFLAALKPGGALVFFFADEREPAPHAGRGILAWDWQHMERAALAWDHTRDATNVTLTLVNEKGEDFIDQHHLYVVRERPGAPARLESLTMRRVYRWDWHALSAALARAGFARAHSRHFRNVKGYTYAMNFAHRPE